MDILSIGLSDGILVLLGASLALSGLLAFRLVRATARTRALKQQVVDARARAGQLRRVEQEQEFITHFIKEFPRLTQELHSEMPARQIPGVLLQMVLRTFDPQEAVVLLRRRQTRTEPERSQRLVVAAAAPPGSSMRQGMEIEMGEGELGYVAQAQRVMDRSELDREGPLDRRLGPTQSLGFKADLAAPMVAAGETLGVVAFAGSGKHPAYAKEVLRLIAQMGAFILANAAAFREMKSVADVDPLTGIYNRRVLNYRLGELLYDAEQQGSCVSIFLFDIDHFKNYNDINGHLAGDRLLKRLVQLVRETVRADDIFGRYGGEEFLLILPDRTVAQAMIVAEQVRSIIAGHPFPHGDRQPLGMVSISGGVATFPAHARDSAGLVRAADAALYRAKQQGRNRIFSASSE